MKTEGPVPLKGTDRLPLFRQYAILYHEKICKTRKKCNAILDTVSDSQIRSGSRWDTCGHPLRCIPVLTHLRYWRGRR